MATISGTDKKSMIRNQFRRSSSADKSEHALMVDISEMSTILNRMGQKVCEGELLHFIENKIDTKHTGHLDYDQFTKVCEKFITSAAALEKIKGDDFLFKHLISSEDFANP